MKSRSIVIPYGEYKMALTLAPKIVDNYGYNCRANITHNANVAFIYNYRNLSNIRRPKSQNWNVSRLGLHLSLRNALEPSVKWRMKMQLEQRRQAMLQLHLSDQQCNCPLKCVLYQRLDGISICSLVEIVKIVDHVRSNAISHANYNANLLVAKKSEYAIGALFVVLLVHG